MEKRNRRTGILLALPVMLGLIVFILVPFVLTVYYSLTFGMGGAQFVGLSNYMKVYQSEMFRMAVWNTCRFLLLGIPLIMVFSFGIALLAEKALFCGRFIRLSLLFPLMVPVASTVMVVEIVLAEKGVLNTWLGFFGLPVEDWLNSPAAFTVLVVLFLWKNTGYAVILLLAGMRMIPKDYYDSAALDGANALQRLRHITLPLLQPTLFFTFVISVLNSFKSFREAFLIGGAHPHESIYLLQHFMNNNFENLNYPRLSVAAITVFAVIFAASLPEAKADAVYTELARGAEGDTVSYLEIGKTDAGIFYRHMLYDALEALYPKGYTVPTDAETVSLSEIGEGIRSLSQLAVLVPLPALSLCMALLVGLGISSMVHREKRAVRKFAGAVVLLLLSLAGVLLVSSRIDIPNSLLPSDNIFYVSHYRALYVSLREIVEEYGVQKSSLGTMVGRIPLLFSLYQCELVFAVCFTVTAGCIHVLQKRRIAE